LIVLDNLAIILTNSKMHCVGVCSIIGVGVVRVSIQLWFVKYLSPLIWYLFPNRYLTALQEFSKIEKISGCQLLYCQKHVEDPHLKAALFQHALEEFFHSDIFAEQVSRLSGQYLNETIFAQAPPLINKGDLNALQNFFAYVHVGEGSINRDFRGYSQTVKDPVVSEVFYRAGKDEGDHEWSTERILLKLCVDDQKLFNKKVSKAKWDRFKKIFSLRMATLGRMPLYLVLSCIYVFLGPFVFLSFRKRLNATRAEQLINFQLQVQDFEQSLK
jgi:hypothetical protein